MRERDRELARPRTDNRKHNQRHNQCIGKATDCECLLVHQIEKYGVRVKVEIKGKRRPDGNADWLQIPARIGSGIPKQLLKQYQPKNGHSEKGKLAGPGELRHMRGRAGHQDRQSQPTQDNASCSSG